ncbi:MAG: hypothetical protein Q9162_006158 [Coniocarpon cinnabarinum]
MIFPALPGLVVGLLKQGRHKPEFPCPGHIPHTSQLGANGWPRKHVYIEAETNEPIKIRVAIFQDFAHLFSCQGLHVYVYINGQKLCTSEQKTEHMRKKILARSKTSKDYIIESVLRKRNNQVATLTPVFVLLPQGNGNDGDKTKGDNAKDGDADAADEDEEEPKEEDDDNDDDEDSEPGEVDDDVATIKVCAWRYDVHEVPKNNTDVGNRGRGARAAPNPKRGDKTARPPKRAPRFRARINEDNRDVKMGKTPTTRDRKRMKLTHGVDLKDPILTSKAWPTKYRDRPKLPRGGQRSVKTTRNQKVYLDKGPSGEAQPLFEALFHYRSREKMLELGIDTLFDDEPESSRMFVSPRPPGSDGAGRSGASSTGSDATVGGSRRGGGNGMQLSLSHIMTID